MAEHLARSISSTGPDNGKGKQQVDTPLTARIRGYGGRYIVTSGGIVQDMEKGGIRISAKPGRPSEGDRVTLGGRKGDSRLVADLVAAAFLENPFGFKHATHVDGNPRNDQLANLSWGPEPLVKPNGENERWVELDWTPHIVTDLGRVIGKDSSAAINCRKDRRGARNFNSTTSKKAKLVADAVAEAFGVPNPFGLSHALHINGDPGDDRLENLTYSPEQLDSSRAANERWAYYEAPTGERLLVSSNGRFISVNSGKMLTGDADGSSITLSHRHRVRKADLVAEAFKIGNPHGLTHALARDGDYANSKLSNITYSPAEVAGMEGVWRAVPGFEERYLIGTCGVFLKTDANVSPFEFGFNTNGGPVRSHKTLVSANGEKETKRIADWMAIVFPELLGTNRFGALHPWNIDGDPSNNSILNLSWLPGPSPQWQDQFEEWELLPEAGGGHIVSNMGRIANLSTGAILHPQALQDGRLIVSVTREGMTAKVRVAEAVASLFVRKKRETGKLVHLNCDPLDNRASNLRWTSEGVGDLVLGAYRHGANPDAIARYHGLSIESVLSMLGLPTLKASTQTIFEGRKVSLQISNEISRSKKARNECLRVKGHSCVVCHIDMREAYGIDANPDVHHLDPLCEVLGTRPVDPVKDLVPVCPNCHRALHSKPGGSGECYTPEELRAMLARRAGHRRHRMAA